MFQPIKPTDFYDVYRTMPADLKDALMSDFTTSQVKNINTKHQLSDNQKMTVADLVAYALMGKLSPKDFTKVLKDELGVDQQTAAAIAQDINRQIFRGVRDSLRDMYGTGSIPEEPLPSANGKAPSTPLPTLPYSTPITTKPATSYQSPVTSMPPVGGLKTSSDVFPSPTAPSSKSTPPTVPPTAPKPQTPQELGIRNYELGKAETSKPPVQPTTSAQQPRQDFAPQNLGGQAVTSIPPAPKPTATPPLQRVALPEKQSHPLQLPYKVPVPPEQIFKRPLPPSVQRTAESVQDKSKLNAERSTLNAKEKPETPPIKQQATADSYKETVTDEDVKNLPPPPPKTTDNNAKLDGNIIDLRNIKVE